MSTSHGKRIPRFRESRLLGSWSDFKHDRLGLLLRVARECGEFGEFRVGPQSLFLANSPAILQELLVEKAARLTPEPFAKSFYPITGRTALPGIDGEYHRRLRRIMAPAFQHKRLVGYSDWIVARTDEYQRGLRDGAELDMVQLMHHLTRDIIAECIFRMDFKEEARFFESVRIAAEFIADGAANPLKLPLSVPTPGNLRTRKAVEYLRQRTMELLATGRQRGDVGDVLSMLLLAKDEDGTGLTEEELRDQTLILYLAGHETSANALSWAWLMLAQHPEVQARVHAEVDAVLGGRPPTYADLARMPYSLQVLKETLRLYPPGHIFGRAPVEDMEIGGYWMRKGQFIMISPYVIHRHPELFPDPGRFEPERFTPEQEKKLPRSAYIPFGDGPHVCIGMHFAMLEMQLVLTHMCQHLMLSPVSNQDVRALPLATLSPSPFLLKVSRRKVSMALAS
jgi:cytochrome P450